MKHRSTSVQPDLFEQNRPRILPAPIHKERLAALVKALLLEIAAALASAFVYIRQSTADQLLHNLESRRRQYGLADRARQLGCR